MAPYKTEVREGIPDDEDPVNEPIRQAKDDPDVIRIKIPGDLAIKVRKFVEYTGFVWPVIVLFLLAEALISDSPPESGWWSNIGAAFLVEIAIGIAIGGFYCFEVGMSPFRCHCACDYCRACTKKIKFEV